MNNVALRSLVLIILHTCCTELLANAICYAPITLKSKETRQEENTHTHTHKHRGKRIIIHIVGKQESQE